MSKVESFFAGFAVGLLTILILMMFLDLQNVGWKSAEKHYLLKGKLKYQYELQIDSSYSIKDN